MIDVVLPGDKKTMRARVSTSLQAVPVKFNLTYMKFKCVDIRATIDFYSTIGMSVISKHEIQHKEGVTTLLSMGFSTNTGTNFLFVHSTDSHQEIASKTIQHTEYVLIYMHRLVRIAALLKSRFKCLLPATDLSDTKLAIFVDPNGLVVRLQELSDLSSKNPSTKTPKTQTKWIGRLGFYAFPSKDANNSLGFYSSLFSYSKGEQDELTRNRDDYVPAQLKKKATQKASKRTDTRESPNDMPTITDTKMMRNNEVKMVNALDDSITQRLKLTTLKKTDIDYTSAAVDSDLSGFKMVDIDDYMIGLCRHLSIWMSCGPRSSSFALCFTEKIDAGDSMLVNNLDASTIRKQSNLISIGFQVEHIDNAVDRIMKRGTNIKMDCEREYIHNFGIFQKFYDDLNEIELDIYCKKEDYEAIAKRGDKLMEVIRKDDRKDEKEKKSVPVKVEGGFEIDFGHLRGTARNLSQGAIHKINTTAEFGSVKKLKGNKTLEGKGTKSIKLPEIPGALSNKKERKAKLGSSHF